MKKITFILSLISLIFLYGCSLSQKIRSNEEVDNLGNENIKIYDKENISDIQNDRQLITKNNSTIEESIDNSPQIFKGIRNLGFIVPNELVNFITLQDEYTTESSVTYYLYPYERDYENFADSAGYDPSRQGEMFINIGEENNDKNSHCFTEEWEWDEVVYTKNYLIKDKKFTEIKYKTYETDRIIIFNTESEGKCLYIDFNLEYAPEEYFRAIFEEENKGKMTQKEIEEFIKKNNEMIVDFDKIRARLIKTVNFY